LYALFIRCIVKCWTYLFVFMRRGVSVPYQFCVLSVVVCIKPSIHFVTPTLYSLTPTQDRRIIRLRCQPGCHLCAALHSDSFVCSHLRAPLRPHPCKALPYPPPPPTRPLPYLFCVNMSVGISFNLPSLSSSLYYLPIFSLQLAHTAAMVTATVTRAMVIKKTMS
jgi:hypothetical protein